MLEIVLLVGSLGIADAVNPVTLAVALYLASAPERPHRRVAGFTAGVLATYGLGGVVLLFGPGRLLAAVVSSTDTPAVHTGSVIAGAVLVIASLVIMRRGRAASLTAAVDRLTPRSALTLGASVTLLDLPTAFPYFAAIAAIAGSGASVPGQLALLAAFNLLYVLPLIVIAALPSIAGRHWRSLARRTRQALDRLAPVLVAALTAVTGIGLIARGAHGLLS